MTCAHSVSAVDDAVRAVHGVATVEVDLASGRLAVTGDGFADAQIARAVDEAGYAVAEAQP
jgi:copper chaperone CopZ